MEDDLELKALKLRKLMKLMGSRKDEESRSQLTFEEALKVVKEHLGYRGDEVLNAAMQQYPEQTRNIVLMLAMKILQEGFKGKISGEALLSLFEHLGIPVKIKTKILYYKKGEYKSIGDLIK